VKPTKREMEISKKPAEKIEKLTRYPHINTTEYDSIDQVDWMSGTIAKTLAYYRKELAKIPEKFIGVPTNANKMVAIAKAIENYGKENNETTN